MQTPNIAIIRYSDDSFLQVTWDNKTLTASEFSTGEPDDSYNSLGWNQIMFSVFDDATESSENIQSFTITNESYPDLKVSKMEHEELYKLIVHIVENEFSDDTQPSARTVH